MKKRITLISFMVIAATGLIFFACNKKDNTSANTNNNNGGGTGSTANITNFSFVSSALKITKGTTVTWTNNDTAPHTVTADDNSFTSGTLNKGDTYSHTFSSTGTINYHCNIHPMMKASVTVN